MCALLDYVTAPVTAAESRLQRVNQQLEMENLRGITNMLADSYGVGASDDSSDENGDLSTDNSSMNSRSEASESDTNESDVAPNEDIDIT